MATSILHYKLSLSEVSTLSGVQYMVHIMIGWKGEDLS